jgi:2-(1,2-epoxy-1,2-dihydrophenyl)acetyl-CoA isomerase
MKLSSIEGIEVTCEQKILRIVINRPHRLNAVTPDQMNYIGQLCADAEGSDDVQVVVITGVEEAFCAGADLSETDLSASGGQIPPYGATNNLFLPILELSKPLIGVVNGVAAGGGLGLALCCDIRIASTKARFSTSFARIGLTANDGVAWLLPRVVGMSKALEMIFIAKPIGADEAKEIGLVSYVKPVDELTGFADGFIQEVAAGPPAAQRLSKRLAIEGMNRSYRDHVLAQEYASLANRTLANEDIAEGVAAFKAKRPPQFQGTSLRPRWNNY